MLRRVKRRNSTLTGKADGHLTSSANFHHERGRYRDPLQIVRWFVQRWQVEVTFREARDHLGLETQRQWSDRAIARTTPCLLALFSIISWRVWRTAQLARDEFGMLVCVGVLALLVFQIFENVGMTMGIMPVTGIPLPLVSYGGSSTIAVFLAFGLVLNVHMRRFA